MQVAESRLQQLQEQLERQACGLKAAEAAVQQQQQRTQDLQSSLDDKSTALQRTSAEAAQHSQTALTTQEQVAETETRISELEAAAKVRRIAISSSTALQTPTSCSPGPSLLFNFLAISGVAGPEIAMHVLT
jgi:septal ring factor EnvC (AmiA/AmiB activator)